MKDKRPVNLNLWTIAFPLPAIISILHRISGVILFVLMPLLLWLLASSLRDASSFAQSAAFLAQPLVKLVIWGLLVALFYHLVAGIRHLLMDGHIGDSLAGGRLGAKIVLALTIIFVIFSGIWLW